jgi:hypothetical protein
MGWSLQGFRGLAFYWGSCSCGVPAISERLLTTQACCLPVCYTPRQMNSWRGNQASS